MKIADIFDKVKKYESELVIGSAIMLVSVTSFGLGRLSILWDAKKPIEIKEQPAFWTPQASLAFPESASAVQGVEETVSETATVTAGKEVQLVASKRGKRYYFPWCSGAQTLKEENKIWFNTEAEAQAKGYTLAANCK